VGTNRRESGGGGAKRRREKTCLGFHCVKPRKVGGRSTSPEGRAVLHQAADESFECALFTSHAWGKNNDGEEKKNLREY